MNFFSKYSIFHKIYFAVFLIFNLIIFFMPIAQGKGVSMMGIVGIIVSISGLFAAIYTARAEVAAYVWGVINTLFYIVISISNHMYAEIILYIIYMLPMNVYGFFAWRQSARAAKQTDGESTSTIEVKSLKPSTWVAIIIGIIVVWAAYATFVYYLPEILQSVAGISIPRDHVWYIDSFTATITIFAVVVSTLRYKETWYFWIVGDGVGIALYIIALTQHSSFSFATLSGAMMWIQFTVNAIYGLIVWKKIGKEQHGGDVKAA
ncbi:nicotinamide riboside transporter PnuC [uncultured Clostridium sp.]|jgi:nicotinamide mononucleotide transporter PnuC|uniref:nicotinamide riboside transporter PnuC n=1 Tax=uncultured Clostridium sp. TaxID=59620 RepID=UPI002616A2C4|nr:nicotinamide riboside transporter PnuC [uncultured Clostridium sp.]